MKKPIKNETERQHHLLMDRLKKTMWKRGISNKSMAEALGVHESTVSRWIQGALQISLRNYIAACNFLNIKIK